jgi:uncharacterized protein with HEPN domain
MINRNYQMFLEDILQSITKIHTYISGLSYDDFVQNGLVFDAVIRNLEVIGEATRHIPENIKNKYTEIPWRRMAGLRNILIHEYFGLDEMIVWEVVTRNLPEVEPLIINLISKL